MSFQQTGLDLGNFLSFLTRRQEVIASNIANADTPGYKTRDAQAPDSFAAMPKIWRDITESKYPAIAKDPAGALKG